MGVRGLTTFIAKNQESYFKRHKLRDTYVVIDAHSLCAQLYKFYTKSNDSFGGDYDKYGRCIKLFFSMLQQCNITPIVIFDGGYEKKKMRTVYMRLKSKIKAIRNANPVVLCGETIFPLFVREVFRDIVLELNIITARCDFEADFEIACIARQLNCPVISYDSDFYIFDVQYIPFPTMDFHTTKINDGKGSSNYIACKIYHIESFLKQFGGLDKSLIPLMATILGNDYIGKSAFKNFYAQLKTPKKKVGERGDQQRQIRAVITWLKEETYESAVRKILGRLKKKHRNRIGKEIKKISQGYICTDSEILKFLNLSSISPPTNPTLIDVDIDNIETDSENEDGGSNSSNSDSEESEKASEGEEKLDLNLITESENASLPEWFKQKYRKAEFPTMFMDILFLKNCFYMPQVENTRNMQTLQIGLPILRAIAKILLADEATYFTYWARNAYGRVKRYNIEISDLKLPTTVEVNKLSAEERHDLLMSILGISESETKSVAQLPSQWHLYFYSLIYWAKNALGPAVTWCHVYSVILCLIYINIVDEIVGYFRVKTLFINKYATKLKALQENKKKNVEESENLQKIPETCLNIKNVNKSDCIQFVNNLIIYFSVVDKMISNGKLYSIHTVDAFAQFQNCLYFTKHLNALLSYPVTDFNISSFFNGTFIYNFHTNLETRHDIDAYMDLLLKNSPSIKQIFDYVANVIKSIVSLKTSESTRKKRRRKHKKAEKTNSDDEEGLCAENENSESEIDLNNKFSILRLVD